MAEWYPLYKVTWFANEHFYEKTWDGKGADQLARGFARDLLEDGVDERGNAVHGILIWKTDSHWVPVGLDP